MVFVIALQEPPRQIRRRRSQETPDALTLLDGKMGQTVDGHGRAKLFDRSDARLMQKAQEIIDVLC